MRKITTRLISAALAASMALSVCPVSALASGGGTDNTVTTSAEDDIAVQAIAPSWKEGTLTLSEGWPVGADASTYYYTITPSGTYNVVKIRIGVAKRSSSTTSYKEQRAAVGLNGNLTVVGQRDGKRDYTTLIEVDTSGDYTFDGNGYTVNFTAADPSDPLLEFDETPNSDNKDMHLTVNNTKFVRSYSGSIDNTVPIVRVPSTATLIMNNCELYQWGGYVIQNDGGTVILNNCTIHSDSSGDPVIYSTSSSSHTELTNCTVYSSNGTAIRVDNGSASIYGGTIKGGKRGIELIKNTSLSGGPGTVTLGGNISFTNNSEADIYLERGYAVTLDGTYTGNAKVKAETPVNGLIVAKNAIQGQTNYFTYADTSLGYKTGYSNGDLYIYQHTHDWSYTLQTADTIKARCLTTSPNTCDYHDFSNPATLTITAPRVKTEGDGKNCNATLEGPLAGVLSLTQANITYTGIEGTEYSATGTAPTKAGHYKASITVGSGEDAVTASVSYDIGYKQRKLNSLIHVTVDKTDVTYGDIITVTPNAPEEGKQLDKVFYVNNTTHVTTEITPNEEGKYIFTMPDADVTIEAQYAPIKYTVTILQGEGENTKTTTINNATKGQEIDLNAQEDTAYTPAGKKLSGWASQTEGVTVGEDGKLTMPAGDVTVQAQYEDKLYTVTLNSDAYKSDAKMNETVTVESDSIVVPDGSKIVWTLTGTLDDGSEISWASLGLTEAPTETSFTFTMPAGTVELKYAYEKIPYSLTLDGCTAQPEGELTVGTIVTITANAPETGKKFKEFHHSDNITDWKVDDEDPTKATFTMPAGPVEISAEFELIDYTVKAENSTVNGTANEATAHYEDPVTVTAVTEKGKTVESWAITGADWADLGLTEAPTGKSFSFNMPAKSFELSYTTRDVAQTVEADQNTTVTTADGAVKPGDEIAKDTVVYIVAKPVEGMKFTGWSITPAVELDKDAAEAENSFKMPELAAGETLKITALYEVVVTPDDKPSDGDAGTGIALVVGGAAIGGAAYLIGTQVYLENIFGFVPANRQELALALWEKADKPEPASAALYADISAEAVDSQKAARWCVEQGLLSDKGEAFKPGDYVFRPQVIKAWNDVQALQNTAQ